MSDYRLDTLGWFQFERLCQTLLTVPYGLQIEVWGGSKDLGRDAYSEGPLRFPDPTRDEPGPFLFQAKFVDGAAELGRRAITQLKAALRTEARRIARLLENEDSEFEAPRHYVIMTNVRVGPSRRTEVTKILGDLLRKSKIHLVHEPQLEVMINAAPGLRLSFPQILSLRDLSGLLDEVVNRDLRNRADALLADAADLAGVFVPTRAHHRTVDVLRKHSFAVLTGPPEMGKTSIAKMVALAQAAEGWDVISCLGPDDFERGFRLGGPQIFVADDAFGSTEYRPQTAEQWGARMAEILQRVDARHWLIWTSRSAPLAKALQKLHLQGKAESFPDPAKVLVKASDLSIVEKTMMLYRHARAADLNDKARALVRAHGRTIVEHDHFTPFRVRRFVRQRAGALAAEEGTRSVAVWRAIREELAEPTPGMDKSFANLDPAQQDLLIAFLDTPDDLSLEAVRAAYHRLQGDRQDLEVEEVGASLEEHFIRRA